MAPPRSLFQFLLLACFIFVGWGVATQADQAHAQEVGAPPTWSLYAEATQEARAVAEEMMAEGLPGMSVAVGVDGAIVWSEAFGYADLENRVLATPATRYRIGSVSKPVTAAAVGLLLEQGKLDLDKPVRGYLPKYPDKGTPFTTRQLGGHLAGIRHYKGLESFSQRRYSSVTASLKIFQDDPLLSPPGEKFSYSSYGYNLISALIEAASGEEFLTYMRENVFGPLGMRDTFADRNELIIENRARFYRSAGGKFHNAPYVDNSYKWAGGGFLSTAEDLVRFGSAHVRPGFLEAETLELLITSQKTSVGKETGYGIGWRSATDSQGRAHFNHGGSSVGGRAYLRVYPDQGVVVAMLVNLSGVWRSRSSDADRIAEFFLP